MARTGSCSCGCCGNYGKCYGKSKVDKGENASFISGVVASLTNADNYRDLLTRGVIRHPRA